MFYKLLLIKLNIRSFFEEWLPYVIMYKALKIHFLHYAILKEKIYLTLKFKLTYL